MGLHGQSRACLFSGLCVNIRTWRRGTINCWPLELET